MPRATRTPRWLLGPASNGSAKVALVVGVLACLSFAALADGPISDSDRRTQELALTAEARAAADRDAAQRSAAAERASRSGERASAANAAAKAPAPPKAAAKPAAKKAPGPPKPVAGLTQAQMNNAQRIVQAGQKLGLPKRAFVIAIATAMQESTLRNLASTAIPESKRYPNEGSGSDHDSVGLFQQRPSAGWGSVKNLMTPSYAASAFYKALRTVAGWQNMALTYAAQAVQVSAYPQAYAKHESMAKKVVDALT